MTCLRIVLLCLAIVPSSFSNDDIHEFMSPEEVQQVFHTDSVPKYEIVKINFSERLHKRDLPAGSKMFIRAFGRNINLWLHAKGSILAGEDTPVYCAKHSVFAPGGVEYWYWKDLMRTVGKMFEDPDKLASFVIGKENSGRTRVNGFIDSERMAVKSLPPRVAEEYRRRRRSVGDFDNFNSPYHVVFKTTKTYERNYPVLPLQQLAPQFPSGIPNILYLEILVVVEYSMYRIYESNVWQLLEYLLAFWNGVALKFRSLMSPRVTLHISGIVLAQDSGATPYIAKTWLNTNAFNSYLAMFEAAKFYYAMKDTFPLNSYDISVTMTRQEFGLKSDAFVLGRAWRGIPCLRDDISKSHYGNTIIRDNGVFSGVIVAAHELGHQLGSYHDETGGHCVYTNGFIMSFTPWYTKNSADFSNCSVEEFDHHLKTNRLNCLFNRPRRPGKKLPNLMPGRIKNLAEQCKALNMGAPCQNTFATPDVCVNIYCLNSYGECTQTKIAAVAGTSCGPHNEFCLHMQCVSL